MLFFNWREVGFLSLAVSLATLPMLGCWLMRKRNLAARIITAMVATPLSLVGVASTIMFSFFALVDRNNHSEPVYSPSRGAAARIDYWGGFGTDGGSNVRLDVLHGLWTNSVFQSDAYVSGDRVVWKNDRELLIYYPRYASYAECHNSIAVIVRCIAEDSPSTSNGTSSDTGIPESPR